MRGNYDTFLINLFNLNYGYKHFAGFCISVIVPGCDLERRNFFMSYL